MHPQMNVIANRWQTCPCKEFGPQNAVSLITFPFPLLNLTKADQELLAILSKDCGSYRRAKHGYRIKTCGFNSECKPTTVEERIQLIPDQRRNSVVASAYSFLLSYPNSHYQHFITMQNSNQFKPKMKFYNLFRIPYIETALWPVLFYSDDLCSSSESVDNPSKLIKKRKFLWKCLSPISDYASDFSILQYHFDRWIYEIVSGTIDSGKKFGVCPATALDGKAFSHTYWRWQHNLLLDTVDQHGYPSLFITLTANEWHFPKLHPFQQRCNIKGRVRCKTIR